MLVPDWYLWSGIYSNYFNWHVLEHSNVTEAVDAVSKHTSNNF
jgi:hypothetical protein